MALIQVDLSVLAIQAYAELDQWEEVLPFVDSVFKGIQHSPVIIIKLCIALLASVGEFDCAHNQALVWLYEPSNQLDAKQYTAVGQFLIEKVFLPQRKLEAIGILLDNLPAIPQQEKVAIKKMLKNVRLTKKKSEQPLVKPELKEFVMITLLRKIGCFLLNRLPPFITNNIHKVSLISFSILLILFHLKTGYASLAGFNVGTLIWRQVLGKTFTSS